MICSSTFFPVSRTFFFFDIFFILFRRLLSSPLLSSNYSKNNMLPFSSFQITKLDYTPIAEKNIFVQRMDCWQDTLEKSERLGVMPEPSVLYKYDEDFLTREKTSPASSSSSTIEIVPVDSIECALHYVPPHYKTIVLNLADDVFPGGCVQMGSGAQEESLFRRSNYHKTLLQNFYPIREDEIVISPLVHVFKASEAENWALYAEPKPMAFVACPGIKYPVTVKDPSTNKPRLSEADAATLYMKIAAILQGCHVHGYDAVVLGALGCGAWRNPVDHVAEIFAQVIRDYDGWVPHIYFAIMTTTDDNYIVKNREVRGEGATTIDIFRRHLLL